MDFSDLDLIAPLLRALTEEGYEHPTPIQEQAIPPVLQGRDVLGCAQTGTGKTAAFALPILQRLAATAASTNTRSGRRPIRALILSPTRELAAQIDESFAAYGRHLQLRNSVIFGGVGQRPQTAALKAGVDILTATPGRLLDLQQQGFVDFSSVQVFVLDEADRMLDMGFIHDVRKVIASLPKQRQTLLFSATMPADIQNLADTILQQPVNVAVAPPATTVELIEQSLYFVEKADKRDLLVNLLRDQSINRTLVFTRTKHGANRVVTHLQKLDISAMAIHGNKSQGARERALEGFKRGRVRVLVATDIAARGIDVESISHVINFDLPNIPETYVHRIGRTARAGASGIALSFCQEDERPYLVDIERLIGLNISVVTEHVHRSRLPAPSLTDLHPSRRRSAAAADKPKQQGRQRRPAPGQRTRTTSTSTNNVNARRNQPEQGAKSANPRPEPPSSPTTSRNSRPPRQESRPSNQGSRQPRQESRPSAQGPQATSQGQQATRQGPPAVRQRPPTTSQTPRPSSPAQARTVDAQPQPRRRRRPRRGPATSN